MVGLLLTIIFSSIMQAQSKTHYPILEKYRKWSIVAGPIIYRPASLTPQYGDYTFQNKPMLGFNAGILYDFHPDKKWSCIIGLGCAKEPVYHVKFTLKKEDIYDHFYEDITDQMKMYSMVSFSSPILLRLNIQLGKKTFLSFLTGLKATLFPHGEAEMTYATVNEDMSEIREVFGLRLESPKNMIQGSFVAGTGFSYAMDKVLLKTNLIYVINFQNTISGEYLVSNLFVSPESRGYYDLSGDYLGLMLSISFKKGKKKNNEKLP